MSNRSTMSIMIVLIYWLSMFNAFVKGSALASDIVTLMSIMGGVVSLALLNITQEQQDKLGKDLTNFKSDVLPDILLAIAAIFVLGHNGYYVSMAAVVLKSYLVLRIKINVIKSKELANNHE